MVRSSYETKRKICGVDADAVTALMFVNVHVHVRVGGRPVYSVSFLPKRFVREPPKLRSFTNQAIRPLLEGFTPKNCTLWLHIRVSRLGCVSSEFLLSVCRESLMFRLAGSTFANQVVSPCIHVLGQRFFVHGAHQGAGFDHRVHRE